MPASGSALHRILAAVQADVDARVSAEILTGAPSLLWGFGPRELARNDAPPRIVWVRRPGTYGPALYQHAIYPARPLRTRYQVLEAHVWTDDDEDGTDALCEQLTMLLVAAVYRVAHGSFEVVGDTWNPSDEMDKGHLCIVTFRFASPVLDDAGESVVLTTPDAFVFDTTNADPEDRILTLGEEGAGSFPAPTITGIELDDPAPTITGVEIDYPAPTITNIAGA